VEKFGQFLNMATCKLHLRQLSLGVNRITFFHSDEIQVCPYNNICDRKVFWEVYLLT
jgi:hypothetical protein